MLLPRVIGHRGAAAYAPENTLVGFRTAARLGVEAVEFDVRLTADDRLVVFHDTTLERTAGVRGTVRALPAAELLGLDVGAWFGPGFAGERMPSLEATVAELLGLGLGANIEMKCEPGDAAATARVLADLLDRHWTADAPPPLVSSFDHDALAALREHAPQWPRGFLCETLDGDWRARFSALDCASVHVGARKLSRAAVAEAKGAGAPVAVYTVNDAQKAARYFAWGVDAIFSDVPDAIARVA